VNFPRIMQIIAMLMVVLSAAAGAWFSLILWAVVGGIWTDVTQIRGDK